MDGWMDGCTRTQGVACLELPTDCDASNVRTEREHVFREKRERGEMRGFVVVVVVANGVGDARVGAEEKVW